MVQNTAKKRSEHGCWSDAVAGGNRRIPVPQLAYAWWCYQERHITPRQFRVYVAMHEMHERRHATKSSRTARFGWQELRRLIGGDRVSDRALASDCDRLRAAGLAQFQQNDIRFSAPLQPHDRFAAFLAELPNNRRALPVPRRVLRLLAAGLPRATAATLMAVLIRGIFWQREKAQLRIDGRVKAGWIARVFALSLRAVKQARKQLQRLALIELLPTSQWERNRWGIHYVINADWQSVAKSAPRMRENRLESAPPDQTDRLSKEIKIKNRNPAQAAERSVTYQVEFQESLAPPRLSDLKKGDLSKFDRVEALYQQAVAKGLAGAGEAGRLDFFALVERAVRRGKEPFKLFSWLLHRQRFDVISDADEDAAARWIKHHLWGQCSRRSTNRELDPPSLAFADAHPASAVLDDAIPY